MKLNKVRIKNFRGLEDVGLDLVNMTTLIGKNNCGKSSILKAIDLLCTGVKPDLEEFYNRDFDRKIEIEVVFDHIEDWERRVPAISGLIYNNKIQLRYIAEVIREGEKAKVEVHYNAYKQEETIQGWSETWGQLSQDIKVIANEIGINTAAAFRPANVKERIKTLVREQQPDWVAYGEARWSDDSITFGNALQQALPKIILIPAVRDALDEMKVTKTSKSAFADLMNKLVLPLVKAEANYTAISEAITTFKNSIHNEDGVAGIRQVNERLSERLKRMINASASIRLTDPEIETMILSNIGLRIHDGNHDTPIDLQGHGLQRTLIFSLLELLAESDAVVDEESTRSTILLFEEPELYLHPQMLRKLKLVLRTIGAKPSWQVVCTTHSPVFIDVAENPQSLIILFRNHRNSITRRQLNDSPFEQSETGEIERSALRAALDFHPTVCEVFFAENVILVEGDTEMALLKHCTSLLECSGVDLVKSNDCTIVSCGGKWTIPAIARLLNRFGISFKVIHDMDRHGMNEEELSQTPPIHPYRANIRIADQCNRGDIFINEDTLEDMWGGAKSDKPFGAIRKIATLIENEMVPDRLVEMVQFAYAEFLQE